MTTATSPTRPNYLAAAFNARPFGMPIPPNWLALAAVGLLGGFLGAGWWLIGAGLEAAYLALVSRNRAFRAAVDARLGPPAEPPAALWARRRAEQLAVLAPTERSRQERFEMRAAELAALFRRAGDGAALAGEQDFARLAWLHLRLLLARQAVSQVAEVAGRDQPGLRRKAAALRGQLERQECSPELCASLKSQLDLIELRLLGHDQAEQKLAFIEAELDKLTQQLELAREQALLATDAQGVAGSADQLGQALGSANAWLREQRELLGHLDYLSDEPDAAAFLGRAEPERRLMP